MPDEFSKEVRKIITLGVMTTLIAMALILLMLWRTYFV
jgi:hypothetical protein